MIKRYCDRCGQQIDEGVHAWYVLELHGTDGEFRHKELCEECYAYLCEKDEVPMPQTDDKCIGCKLTDGEYCYCPEECEVCDRNEPQTDNGIGCSRCEGRFDCYDRDMPYAVRCNNYGKITDEPQTEMVKCYKCRWWNYSYGCGNPKGICEFEERYQVKRSE